MSKVISILVVIILIGGGAYYYMNYYKPVDAQTDTQTQTNTTPQVAGQDAVVGTGAEAKPGSEISVLYVGMLQDGTVFDSSANNDNKPLVFVLGTPGIIPGFQIGVNGMKEGGERRIQIPPELGYGSQEVKDAAGKVIIPANSTITFDIKLVKVGQPAVQGASTTAPATE